jgi:hypothetical protein
MTKPSSRFPVRGVPGGWRDAWSGPDAAAVVQAQFATWAANAAAGTRGDRGAPPSTSTETAAPRRPARPFPGDRVADTDRHILLGVSQPTDDPSQHRAFVLRAHHDAAAGGWVAQIGEQNRNDQIDGWEAAAGLDVAPLVFPTAAACLGAAVTRLIEVVDRDVVDPAPSA